MSANNWEWAGPPDSVAEHLAACKESKRDARIIINIMLRVLFMKMKDRTSDQYLTLQINSDYLIGMQPQETQQHLHKIQTILEAFYACDDYWFVQYESETERYSGIEQAPCPELALCRAYASLQYPGEEGKLQVNSIDAFWRHFEMEYSHLIEEVEGGWLRINNVWIRRGGTAFDYKDIPKIPPEPLDQTDEV